VRLHKIIQTVTDTDALHSLMQTNIATGSLVNLSLSNVDNLTPRFKAVTDIDKLFA
jgi:hypothetical protein